MISVRNLPLKIVHAEKAAKKPKATMQGIKLRNLPKLKIPYT